MSTNEHKALKREILLAFWKVHILHHAESRPVVGLWMLRELQRHGYEVSPGTIYPLLARMAERGWLSCQSSSPGAGRPQKRYRLTNKGRQVLAMVREQLEELYREVVLGEQPED